MTKEDKQLLLKDLCARLPYGVKVCARFNTGNRYTANITAICADRDYIQIRQNVLHPYTSSSVEDIRPYLRPLSSMTEEEKEEWADIFNKPMCELSSIMDEKEAQEAAPRLFAECHTISMDWLLMHHFDNRGLIPMGLALESTKDMYKTE